LTLHPRRFPSEMFFEHWGKLVAGCRADKARAQRPGVPGPVHMGPCTRSLRPGRTEPRSTTVHAFAQSRHTHRPFRITRRWPPTHAPFAFRNTAAAGAGPHTGLPSRPPSPARSFRPLRPPGPPSRMSPPAFARLRLCPCPSVGPHRRLASVTTPLSSITSRIAFIAWPDRLARRTRAGVPRLASCQGGGSIVPSAPPVPLPFEY